MSVCVYVCVCVCSVCECHVCVCVCVCAPSVSDVTSYGRQSLEAEGTSVPESLAAWNVGGGSGMFIGLETVIIYTTAE